MNRVYSNGPSKDFVINPFKRLIEGSSRLYLAAPFFTAAAPIVEAAEAGKSVQLLVGLNGATSGQALSAVHGRANVDIRYLTHRFHAKIFIFDNCALVGSSNLTDGGLVSNREAVICLDQEEDHETIEEVRSLFMDLWESGQVLTPEKLKTFNAVKASIKWIGPDPDAEIEKAIGRAEPVNIKDTSQKPSRERIFLNDLQRQVYEQYRPAFSEVSRLLDENDFRRPELEGIGLENETNRFLNWVRRTHVVGDEKWKSAPLRQQEERRAVILSLGAEWAATNDSKVPEDYVAWLRRVQQVFGSVESIESASMDALMEGLMSIHAFNRQSQYVKGGAPNLPGAFWAANNENLPKVKNTLAYLLHGSGDFVERLHDVLYDPALKLGYFGRFCALELYGTVKPENCPPMNGRMAKALRYLGYNVSGT